MKALITGASGGLGLDFAKQFSEKGYDLILVARSKEKLEDIEKDLKTNVEIIPMDLSIQKNVFDLYEKTKGKVDFLINNAGFGVFGEFDKTDIEKELNLIDLNVKAYHILTKLFLQEFKKRDEGRILNVASSAAFQPGPLLSSYYASKAYVYSLTSAVYEELRREKSNIKISILCPGPVKTGFNDRAKVSFNISSLESSYVVSYALKQCFKDKLVIIPGWKIRAAVFSNRLLSRKSILKITYNIQKRKAGK